ncbi:DUF1080 domain-containing protein [Opitutaceae bacterium]|nr:DUF1080 domain-containing protein [Opitutaceae bacterium]
MKTSLSLLLASLVIASSAHAAHHERTVIFADDFTGRTEVGPNYTTHAQWKGDWTVVDGVLVGKQLNPGHGATIRLFQDFTNLDMEFDFRFNGGTRWNFVVDDQNYAPVHAGHICRLSILPKSIKVADDKTGSMDLNILTQRQDENLPEDQRKALDAFLATKQAEAPLDLNKGQWYKLRVTIDGDVMSAYIDGKKVTSLRSPGFAHPIKNKFGFTVNGSTTEFDNIKIYRAPSAK